MTDVDICNMALSFLGDAANVSSIDPPDGSAQADHCARFLPIVKKEILEAYPWSFATRTESLARVWSGDENAPYNDFAIPSDCVRILNILPYPLAPIMPPIPEVQFIRMRRNGAEILRIPMKRAWAVYISEDISTDSFTASVAEAMAWLLAAKLAGSVLGGTSGPEMAANCNKQYLYFIEQAKLVDANQTNDAPAYLCGLSGDYQEPGRA